jgi:hypothetical protein
MNSFTRTLRGAQRWASRLTLSALAAGCGLSSHRIADDTTADSMLVRLDANARVIDPSHRLKFFVDIVNETGGVVDVSDIAIELAVSKADEPERTRLRRTWKYSTGTRVDLQPGKKATFPIVPEVARRELPEALLGQADTSVVAVSEFPLTLLEPGDYNVVARVNDRWSSEPYPLSVPEPRELRVRSWPAGAGRPSAPNRSGSTLPVE